MSRERTTASIQHQSTNLSLSYTLICASSPGAGGGEARVFAELSSSLTSPIIHDERRLNPLWQVWGGEADAHAAGAFC